jgi:hypothetical protein
MIEAELAVMRGDPEVELLAWLGRSAALDNKRCRYHVLVAEGHITFDELGAKLRELEADRATTKRELEDLNARRSRRSRLDDLERDKEILLKDYAGMVPDALDELTGEARHQVYRMLRLQMFISPNCDLDVRGVRWEVVCTSMDRQS